MKKKCNKCNKNKDTYLFKKDSSKKDGLRTVCSKCDIDSYRSRGGIVSTIYGSQKRTSKRRGHKPPEYTKEQLREWLHSNDKFHIIYNSWKDSGYKKELKPSVDRIDDNTHYTIDNIQLMTWGENNKKGNDYILNGKHITTHRRVVKINNMGEVVDEYFSISDAARKNKLHNTHIVSCCKGKLKTTGGFSWRYKDV